MHSNRYTITIAVDPDRIREEYEHPEITIEKLIEIEMQYIEPSGIIVEDISEISEKIKKEQRTNTPQNYTR